MQKRARCLLLALMVLLLCAVPVGAADLGISAPSAILMEKSTGQILYEQDAHTRLAPASVT